VENSNGGIRVLIADDHPIFRDGLTRLLNAERGMNVIGAAEDGLQAVEMVQKLSPDVLLLDLIMPRMPGLDALRELSVSPHPVRTILLTAAIEKAEIATALQMGARGVVLKDAATQLLFKCIRCVMNGEYWVGRESVGDLVAALRQMRTDGELPRKRNFGLTPREMEVVGTIVAGLTNREIAKKLSVSEDTVKHHITNIFDKLGVSNRLELALFAINHQLIAK
jgi:two-component system, NarL family, nitrate/nitrite response regulator NarL